MSIGERIKRCRDVRGLSQAELAKQLGMKNGSTVANWERGYSSPSVERIAEICSVMHVSADYLIGTVGDDLDIEGLEAIKVVYPTLDERGQTTVLAVLNAEASHCKARDLDGAKEVEIRRERRVDKDTDIEKFIERSHPRYCEMVEQVSRLKRIKRKSGKGNEGLLYYLWWSRLPIKVCLGDIVAIFRGLRVPSPEFYRYIEAYFLGEYEVVLK